MVIFILWLVGVVIGLLFFQGAAMLSGDDHE